MRRTRHRVAPDVVPVDGERAAVGRDERGHHADERGLAGAVGTEDGHRLSGGQGEGQPGEGLDLPELLGEAVGLDERVHARLLPWVVLLAESVPRRSPTLSSAASGEGPSWIGLVVVRARDRVVSHAASGHSSGVIPWGARR